MYSMVLILLLQGIIYSILGDKHMADQRFQSYNKLCPKDLPDRKYLDSIMIRAKRQGAKIDEAKQKQKSHKSGEVNDTKKKQSWKKPSKDELEAWLKFFLNKEYHVLSLLLTINCEDIFTPKNSPTFTTFYQWMNVPE